MLFYPKNKAIFSRVFYDEPSSTLMVFYTARSIVEYYRVDRVFFYKYVLKQLNTNQDFRPILYWGIKNKFVAKLSNKNSDIELVKLNHLSIYDK